MLKINKRHGLFVLAGLASLLALLGVTARVSYYLGERYVSELVLHAATIPDGKLNYTPPNMQPPSRVAASAI